MDAGGNAQSESYPEQGPIKRKLKVLREKKDEDEQSGFNKIDCLIEEMRSRDNSEGSTFWSVSRSHGSHHYQDDSGAADQEASQTSQRGVGTEDLGENLGNQQELERPLDDQASPVQEASLKFLLIAEIFAQV